MFIDLYFKAQRHLQKCAHMWVKWCWTQKKESNLQFINLWSMNFKPTLITSTCATRVYVNDFRKFSVEQKWSKRKRETFWKTRSRQHTKGCVDKARACVLQWAVWRGRAWFFKCSGRFAWPFWACCRRRALVIVSLTPPVTATLFPHSYGQYQATLELIHLQRFISTQESWFVIHYIQMVTIF